MYPLPALSCMHGFARHFCLPPGPARLRQYCRSSNAFLKKPFLNVSFGLFLTWYYISYSHRAAVWDNVPRRTWLRANTNAGDADRWRNHTVLQEGRAGEEQEYQNESCRLHVTSYSYIWIRCCIHNLPNCQAFKYTHYHQKCSCLSAPISRISFEVSD